LHPYVASNNYDYKKAYALYNDYLFSAERPHVLKVMREQLTRAARRAAIILHDLQSAGQD
jgi:hypothetical protein